MGLDPAGNFDRSSLTSDAAAGDTTLDVNDASEFIDPSSQGNYNLIVWDVGKYPSPYEDPSVEIVRVTDRDTNNNTLTVTRGQEKTAAASHPSGGAVMNAATAKLIDDIHNLDHTSAEETLIPSTGLASDSVTTPKIATDAVTAAKIATDAVTTAKIATDAVTLPELDESIAPTWAASHIWDTGGNANLAIDEDGLSYNTGNAETLAVENTGSGSVALSLKGNIITEIGGTDVPSSGALRFPYGASLRFRTGSLSQTIEALGVGTYDGNNDVIALGQNGQHNQIFIGESSGFVTLQKNFVQFEGEALSASNEVGFEITDGGADPTGNGVFARNGSDVKVYSGGAVRNLSNVGSGGGSPGGNDTEIQFNNAGSFGGISDLTYDGTNLSAVPGIDATLSLVDQAADPSTNGEVQLNGTDIKAYSGGGVVNLSSLVDNSRSLTGGTGIQSIGDLSADRTIALASDGVTDTELGVDPFSFDPGMTEWEDGLSDEEINRIVLQSGETLVIERIEFRQKGGGSSSSASIDVRDTTAASTIGSQNLGGTTKDPGSSGTGNTVIIRASNSTGGSINAAPRVEGYITGA